MFLFLSSSSRIKRRQLNIQHENFLPINLKSSHAVNLSRETTKVSAEIPSFNTVNTTLGLLRQLYLILRLLCVCVCVCVCVYNSTFERVEEFKYLGTTLTNQNSIAEEIKSRLRSGNARYRSVQSILSSRLLSKNL